MSTDGLEVRGLEVSYGMARVLDSVDLSVGCGEIIGLVGANGAGKTTTLRSISGMVPRSAGTVLFAGTELPTRPELVVARGVAHVPEGRCLMPSLSVVDNLRFSAYASRQPFGETELDNIRALFPTLAPLMARKAGLLSGGEQQMTAIARGLVSRPRLLLVDELSLGLSPKIVIDLLRTLVNFARSRSVGLLLVDQNVRALAEVCDSMYTLKTGRATLATGQPDEYLDAYLR